VDKQLGKPSATLSNPEANSARPGRIWIGQSQHGERWKSWCSTTAVSKQEA